MCFGMKVMKPDVHLVENSSCFDALSTSYDNRIAVATDKYVYILEQTYNPSFRFDCLCLSKDILKDTKEDHQFYDVGIDTSKVKTLRKGLYVRQRFALNGLLWDRDSTPPHPERFRTVKFSPMCDDQERSILATLSFDNRILVYCTSKQQNFMKVANLSDKLYEYAKRTNFTLSSDGKDDDVSTYGKRTKKEEGKKEQEEDKEGSIDFQECRRKMNSVSFTGMEWSVVFSPPKEISPPVKGKRKAKRKHLSCDTAITNSDFILLATALKSNHIVLWRFPCPVNQNSPSELAAIIHTDDQPTAMGWCDYVNEKHDEAFLATGGYDGSITVWNVSTIGDVIVLRELDVWKERDDIPIQALTWVQTMCNGSTFVLLAAKGPCVLIFQLQRREGNMNIAHQSHTLSLHSALVSGICYAKDKVYTSSTDGSIQVAQVKQDNGISVELNLLEQPRFMSSRINGMSVSPNSVYITTLSKDTNYAKVEEKSSLKFIQIATDQEVEQMLLEPKGRLCYKFDCLDWLYQRLSPDGAIQDTTETILSDDLLSNKTQSEIGHLLKLRRFTMMMIMHRLSQEIYNTRGRKRDNLEEIIKTNAGQVREISDRILKLHVKESLEKIPSDDDGKNCSGRTKLVQKLMSDWLEVDNSHSQEPVTLPDTENGHSGCESCRLCGENIPLTSREEGSCQNGHRWKRCSLSLMVCQTLKPNRCAFCRTSYASKEESDDPWLQNLLSSHCLWCDGPLTNR